MLDIKRVSVIDGDTFAYGNERIRIHGIDTPELSEPGGVEAADRLRALLQEGPVTMVSGPTDDYGRTLADVFANRRNLAQILVAEGYAKQH
jgi:endonuclease YncB( thermonuclease family)